MSIGTVTNVAPVELQRLPERIGGVSVAAAARALPD